MAREFLSEFGTVNVSKVYTSITGKNKKVACVTKRRISLQDYKPEYGAQGKALTDEEIKRRHLGKVKCILKFKTDDELKQILTKYFE